MNDPTSCFYCQKCGKELNSDEFGEGECDTCAFLREPWESCVFYCDDEDEDLN